MYKYYKLAKNSSGLSLGGTTFVPNKIERVKSDSISYEIRKALKSDILIEADISEWEAQQPKEVKPDKRKNQKDKGEEQPIPSIEAGE